MKFRGQVQLDAWGRWWGRHWAMVVLLSPVALFALGVAAWAIYMAGGTESRQALRDANAALECAAQEIDGPSLLYFPCSRAEHFGAALATWLGENPDRRVVQIIVNNEEHNLFNDRIDGRFVQTEEAE